MSGTFLIVLLAAAAAVQTVTAEGGLVCFAVSTTEVCTCPSQCQCLPATDDGVCSKNSCDCNGNPTTMTSEKGTINNWPGGGWGGADWGSHPKSDWWYPGKDGQYWPGIPKDDKADVGKYWPGWPHKDDNKDGSGDSSSSSSSNDTDSSSGSAGSEDDDPPFNPDLEDPTEPSSGNNSTVVERDTPGNPSRPPPPASINTVNTGSSSGSNQNGPSTNVQSADISGAMQTRMSTVQSLGLALVCLLAALGVLVSS